MDKADIVVIPAGLPRKPGMKREDLVDVNASVACEVAFAASEVCPGAMLAFITNPINVIVPIVATILKAKGIRSESTIWCHHSGCGTSPDLCSGHSQR